MELCCVDLVEIRDVCSHGEAIGSTFNAISVISAMLSTFPNIGIRFEILEQTKFQGTGQGHCPRYSNRLV